MDLIYATPAQAWHATVRRALEDGVSASPRGIVVRELIAQQFTVLDPLAVPFEVRGRAWHMEIGLIEACSLVGQVSNPEVLTRRFHNFERFVKDGVLWGAYGPRIAGSLGLVIKSLTDDEDTRQAVLTIFSSSRDVCRDEPDIPCTLSIQFLIRDGLLHQIVTMRSNDVWLGLPYDLVQFGALQSAVAQAMGIRVGTYTHQAGSLHLYEKDAYKVDELGDPPESGSPEPRRLWGGSGWIGDTSARARMCLTGEQPAGATEFEVLAARAVRWS